LVSATATSGTAVAGGANTATWNGSVPAAGSVTITITATVNAGAQCTTITNQGTVAFDADLNGTNESTTTTDDPAVGGANDPTVITIDCATLTATKTAAGSFTSGSIVTYSIVISNSGNTASADVVATDELTDVLPASLTLTGASATAGTALATLATNTVTWNGSVPAGGSVTVTITATIKEGFVGATASNQGSLSYDGDLNGSAETTTQTDDPGLGGRVDPTTFVIQPGTAAEVPTLSEVGLAALVLALLSAAWVTLRRRKSAV